MPLPLRHPLHIKWLQPLTQMVPLQIDTLMDNLKKKKKNGSKCRKHSSIVVDVKDDWPSPSIFGTMEGMLEMAWCRSRRWWALCHPPLSDLLAS